MQTSTNEGLRELVKEYVLKLYKFSNTHPDIKVVNPITPKDLKSIRASVKNNLTRAGGYFDLSDSQLISYLKELGGELTGYVKGDKFQTPSGVITIDGWKNENKNGGEGYKLVGSNIVLDPKQIEIGLNSGDWKKIN